MQLNRNERWILSNQFLILAALYPKDAKRFDTAREAIEYGYELHYDMLSEHLYEDVMSHAECKEVVNIMEMFEMIKRAYDALKDKSGITEYSTQFRGFDGNSEGKQMTYARYFCRYDGPRFPNLGRGDDFNSHSPSLDRYRGMVREWDQSADKHQLTKEDLIRITSA